MEYLPFKITEYNETRQDKVVELNSEVGSLWVRVGKVDIEIKQMDNGLGITIEALDSQLCEQELGSMDVWYNDIEWNDQIDDSKYPIH